MSKGPGRVERIIVATLEAHPDACFTVPDLARLIYPEVTKRGREVEKKHRSAITRAAKAVLPEGWDWLKADAPGAPPVYFNCCSFASWGRALTRCRWPHDPARAEATFAEPYNDHWKEQLAVGGRVWRLVEAARLRRDGKPAEAEAIEQALDREYRILLASAGIILPAAPP